MAKYWSNTFEIDLSQLDLSEVVRGRGSTTNEHTLKIGYGGGYATTIKGDFDLNGKGIATGGTITRISFEDDDHYGTVISGLRLDLDEFVKVAKSKSLADDANLYAKMLSGADTFTGDSGGDVINGFGGSDTIIGGLGSDILTGGAGADVFVYKSYADSTENLGVDTIEDFSQADGDKINLTGLGFLDFASDVRVSTRGGDTAVEIDVPNGTDFEMIIRVRGNVDFTASDFIL